MEKSCSFYCSIKQLVYVASDLLRAYPGDCKISFVKLSSHTGMESTGKVFELIGLKEVVEMMKH